MFSCTQKHAADSVGSWGVKSEHHVALTLSPLLWQAVTVSVMCGQAPTEEDRGMMCAPQDWDTPATSAPSIPLIPASIGDLLQSGSD